MNIGAASIFIVILVLGLFVNKYVLSVLGFKYPTIFQVRLSHSFLLFIFFIILFLPLSIHSPPLPATSSPPLNLILVFTRDGRLSVDCYFTKYSLLLQNQISR